MKTMLLWLERVVWMGLICFSILTMQNNFWLGFGMTGACVMIRDWLNRPAIFGGGKP